MDLNFIGKWTSFWLFFACSLIYIFYFFKYSGLFLKKFEALTKAEVALFKLTGASHLLLSLQMLTGLYYVLKLNPPIAAAHVGFSGLSILVISILKLINLDTKYHSAKIEITLVILGFVFLSLHILSRVFQ